jgi:hypothetical protein
MEASTTGLVSHRELRRLAIKLRQDLISCEEKLGAHENLPSSWILPVP